MAVVVATAVVVVVVVAASASATVAVAYTLCHWNGSLAYLQLYRAAYAIGKGR